MSALLNKAKLEHAKRQGGGRDSALDALGFIMCDFQTLKTFTRNAGNAMKCA